MLDAGSQQRGVARCGAVRQASAATEEVAAGVGGTAVSLDVTASGAADELLEAVANLYVCGRRWAFVAVGATRSLTSHAHTDAVALVAFTPL